MQFSEGGLMRDEASIPIGGRRWKIKLVPARSLPQNTDGTCSFPAGRFPQIEVRKSLSEKQILTTLVHELLHASCDLLSEEAVVAISCDVARGLWAMGYRRP